ncbi:L-2-hydroxyglutarate oxidase [Gracilimonas sp. CAU 1638]|uniref:L-2-hydroxyglutarate oxidase n=2 Tax=Gracilimonas sediminicola TaxID=2952158 RepID=A0A9X2RFM8_9BACT|nr:L-2-hydroxyglutarate oxidase [Gracilimonas sediminicola]MCP9290998.1 L-2-hydroxyglutarate oxidase [Gracilimonas sediminicola]
MMYDFTIVGAGIVGLSTAYKLSLKYPEARILVVEKENKVAAHQTGKNSGVIHSGIYYKPGSYKAKNCVDGRHQLVDFCKKHGVAIEICGKVIVAADESEVPKLKEIYERGLQNEIEGIELIDADRLNELEPYVQGVAAIHVPCSGIVDYAGMCRKLMGLLEEGNGEVRFNSAVSNISNKGDEVVIEAGGDKISTRFLINCAGLYSDHVARFAGIHSPVKIVPFKGEYYELKPEAEYLVNDLIYPLPNPEFPFLGVHFTRMALGGIECGPNAVFAFKREGYKKLSFNLKETTETFNFPGFWKMAKEHWRMGLDEYKRSFSKKAFVKGLQKLIPDVREEHLKVSPAGIRAMALQPNGEILDDFYFEVVDRQIHVLNAPSPAATAGLAIGDEIVKRVEANFTFQQSA